ncbi:MAG: HPr family phosphocarrier protein [Clostridia bacterium]
MKKTIKVKNTSDIQKINQVVVEFPFDIWIHSQSGMVDAKSLLGMFLLGINEPLDLVIPDDVDGTDLFKRLETYLEIN